MSTPRQRPGAPAQVITTAPKKAEGFQILGELIWSYVTAAVRTSAYAAVFSITFAGALQLIFGGRFESYGAFKLFWIAWAAFAFIDITVTAAMRRVLKNRRA